ncbi:MAG: VanZ family protein [Gemmataceae bacterium]
MALSERESVSSSTTSKREILTSEQILGWIGWTVLLTAWTIALWVPGKKNAKIDRSLPAITTYFLVSKTLHLAAYGVLGALVLRLRIAPQNRWIPVYLLMLHASLTEVCQLYWFDRTGLVLDVAFNHIGIGLGLLYAMVSSRTRSAGEER